MNDMVPDIDTELDVIFGEYRDQDAVAEFVRAAREANLTGTLYIGYPVLSVDDERIEFDAVLISRNRGVVIFDLYSYSGQTPDPLTSPNIPEDIAERQEQLYAALYNKLNSFGELRKGRRLLVEISTATIHPIGSTYQQDGENQLIGLARLADLLQIGEEERLNDDQILHLNAAIQRISNLKPRKKRNEVSRADSKGGIIKEIEKQIANLDLWQKRGSIEYVNGPQRIRGLAGSGKTVVLALKAAYLHVKRPDWDIVVTFNTRSLYQQFEALITRFVYSQINEEPDWDKLHIMHAWGGSDRRGVYSNATAVAECQYRDFGTAARLFGYGAPAFAGACQEALDAIGENSFDIYDMILVDEAQDLPVSFFRLLYKLAKKPKRIVWAYDDLQNLGDTHLPSAQDLFGTDPQGKPLVTLPNDKDKPQRDIVLPRCYRNPPWTLLTAHGLGFGLKRQPKKAQIFPDPNIWKRLGYGVSDGELDFDKDVTLERAPESVPGFFKQLLTTEDTLQFVPFEDPTSQQLWVAQKIKDMIEIDELQHSDFLIVLPNVRTSKSVGAAFVKALRSVGLNGHIPGQTSSQDEIFREGSIAITHIHRAKGNEAPVVFVTDAQYCEGDFGLKTRRNILFTAMTRSRAWTFVTGVGDAMVKLIQEFEAIQTDKYTLSFHYPTKEEAVALAVSTDAIEDEAIGSGDEFADLRAALEKTKNKGGIEQLPLDLRDMLREISGGD